MFKRLSGWLRRSNRVALTETEAQEIARELNAPLSDHLQNPPPAFESKHAFSQSDVSARVRAIDWFVRCGSTPSLDLTMPVQRVDSWEVAVASCSSAEWEDVELEAQNQLTIWLSQHDRDGYRRWNRIVKTHKRSTVEPLIEKTIRPIQLAQGLHESVISSVQWDVLGALMENSYLPSGHSAMFFLELLQAYEAGHFPCGWLGEWPIGKLVVF